MKILLIMAVPLMLGGCVSTMPDAGNIAGAAYQTSTVAKVDAKISQVSSALYKACGLAQAAGMVAAIYYDNAVVARVNAGIASYCNSTKVTDVPTALVGIAQVYKDVSVAGYK